MLDWLVGATMAPVLDSAASAAGAVAGLGPVREWFAGCKERALGGRFTPGNHDLVKGVRTAHLYALDHVARRHRKALQTVPRDAVGDDDAAFAAVVEDHLRRRLTVISDRGIDHDVLSAADIAHVLEQLVHAASHESYAALGRQSREKAEARALAELTQAAGCEAPPLFVRLFKGDPSQGGAAGWYTAYSLFVTEELKTNERFRSIFFATELVDIRRVIGEIDAMIRRTVAAFPDLEGFSAEVRTQLDRIEGLQRQALDQTGEVKADTTAIRGDTAEMKAALEELLRRLPPQDAQGVPQATILELARRIVPTVETVDQALVELENAVVIAAKAQRGGAAAGHLGAFVAGVLDRLAELNRENRFDDASRVADRAFADWEREEAERQEQAQASGLALLDAAVTQDLLRRDAVAVAARLARRVDLTTPDPGARFEALRAIQAEWYMRGRNNGINLDVEVAIALARGLAGRARTQDERGTALNQLGNALTTRGERDSDTARLEDAVEAYRAARDSRDRQTAPLAWAATQNNLANVLRIMGDREQRTERFDAAIRAFDSALEERRRDVSLLDWASTMINLGIALLSKGERESGTATLERSVAVLEEVLEILKPDDAPFHWSTAKMSVATAYLSLGERGSSETLKRAEATYVEALAHCDQTAYPLDWAAIQNNLGNVLLRLGECDRSVAEVARAISAYRAALSEWKQDRVPLDWAMAQYNLGRSYLTLGELEDRPECYAEAASAFAQALLERTRRRVPLQWAESKNGLGTALSMIARQEDGTGVLKQAIAAFDEALEEISHKQAPYAWAQTLNNRGVALTLLGERTGRSLDLLVAEQSLTSALDEWTLERLPLQWADATGNRASARVAMAELENDPALARAALDDLERAAGILHDGGQGSRSAHFRRAADRARDLIARLETAPPPPTP